MFVSTRQSLSGTLYTLRGVEGVVLILWREKKKKMIVVFLWTYFFLFLNNESTRILRGVARQFAVSDLSGRRQDPRSFYLFSVFGFVQRRILCVLRVCAGIFGTPSSPESAKCTAEMFAVPLDGVSRRVEGIELLPKKSLVHAPRSQATFVPLSGLGLFFSWGSDRVGTTPFRNMPVSHRFVSVWRNHARHVGKRSSTNLLAF